MPKIYFISGVSGVGKSTNITYLQKLLPASNFDIRDFDERGVPDGGGQEWHNKETRYWLDFAKRNAVMDKSTIVCGFINPEPFKLIYKIGDVPVQLILLDAKPETIKQRLLGRYPTKESEIEIERASGVSLEQFAADCARFAPQLKTIFQKTPGALIIDTENKNKEEVANKIIDCITF